MLLYSFIQAPYDSVHTSLPIQRDLELLVDPEQVLRMLIHYPKLSTFCIRRIEFSNADLSEIKNTKNETGYLFISLAAKAYLLSPVRELLLHRKPLASADDESFEGFRFSPLVWSRLKRAVDFPEFWQACPHVLLSLNDDELRAMLLGAFQHETGKLTFEPSIYREIVDYLSRNRLRLLQPKYYKYLAAYMGAVASRRIGLQKPYARFLDWMLAR